MSEPTADERVTFFTEQPVMLPDRLLPTSVEVHGDFTLYGMAPDEVQEYKNYLDVFEAREKDLFGNNWQLPQDQELQDQELQDQELQDQELQDQELQDQELQDQELQDQEQTKDPSWENQVSGSSVIGEDDLSPGMTTVEKLAEVTRRWLDHQSNPDKVDHGSRLIDAS